MTDDQTSERPPIAYHPSVLIIQELLARGWTKADLAVRMGGDAGLNLLALDFYLHVHDPDLRIGADGSRQLGEAFGVSPEFFTNLEAAWLAYLAAGPHGPHLAELPT